MTPAGRIGGTANVTATYGSQKAATHGDRDASSWATTARPAGYDAGGGNAAATAASVDRAPADR